MSERTPLVLCPGLLCDEALWGHQFEHLADIVDVSVADFTRQDSIRAMAEAVLSEAPPRFAIAGLSMGGYVAQEIMRLAPERVLKLALLDTSARIDGEEYLSRRRGLLELARKGKFKGVTPALLPMLIHPSRLDDRALTGAITAMAARVGQQAFLSQQTAIMGRVDSRADLADLACPTLVLCGRDDQLTPLDGHVEMAEAIPGADLIVLGACGHLSTMERPEAVTGALRGWLTRKTA